jgi:hypothetical protein
MPEDDLDEAFTRGWFEGLEDAVDAILELPDDCTREQAIARVEALEDGSRPMQSAVTIRVKTSEIAALFRVAESLALPNGFAWRDELKALRDEVMT